MNTTRMDARRLEEGRVNKNIPPQVEKVEKVLKGAQRCQGAQSSRNAQVPIVEEGDDVLVVPPEMTNREIRESLITLARPMITHVNIGVTPRVNSMEGTMTSILKDFDWMNPPIILVSMMGEDPKSP
ncbi:hypothetical protein EJD97_021303 [Solanum chilense]|uniref:Uncharacterized protein n=1 Tax=Solanum chilense TaxID=4083 RepID=A0A6N2B3H5_SOLCI|nr:hypothetical protein EJD97_021303 [Solanum chilense]